MSGYTITEGGAEELVIRWDEGGELSLSLPTDPDARFLVNEVADQLGQEVVQRMGEGVSFEQASLEEQAKALAALEGVAQRLSGGGSLNQEKQ